MVPGQEEQSAFQRNSLKVKDHILLNKALVVEKMDFQKPTSSFFRSFKTKMVSQTLKNLNQSTDKMPKESSYNDRYLDSSLLCKTELDKSSHVNLNSDQ